MPTYIALSTDPQYVGLWRHAASHLSVVSAFDTGLSFRPVPRNVKTLFGFTLLAVTYSPTHLKHEGRKVLHSVINYVGVLTDVLISPLRDTFQYTDPADVAVIKKIPWTNQAATSFQLSDFGGGLTTTRTDRGALVWSVEYDAQLRGVYEGRAMTGGGAVQLSRPDILFHELAHVDMEGDPLPGAPPPSTLSYTFKEGIIVSRENGFRLSRNPRLHVSQLRSTTDLVVTHTP